MRLYLRPSIFRSSVTFSTAKVSLDALPSDEPSMDNVGPKGHHEGQTRENIPHLV